MVSWARPSATAYLTPCARLSATMASNPNSSTRPAPLLTSSFPTAWPMAPSPSCLRKVFLSYFYQFASLFVCYFWIPIWRYYFLSIFIIYLMVLIDFNYKFWIISWLSLCESIKRPYIKFIWYLKAKSYYRGLFHANLSSSYWNYRSISSSNF